MALTSHARSGRPILVTGSHRSGSTWVGKLLAAAPGVRYIHEPFSARPTGSRAPGVSAAPCHPRFTTWYTYVTTENESEYRERIERIVNLRYHWLAELREFPTPRGIVNAARQGFSYRASRERGDRPLIKDPIALMSSEWLASTFNAQVVALIRHPCAFVSSLRRMNWRFRFESLLSQPLLMRDLLGPFEDEMRRMDATDHDMIDNGAVIWKILHHVIRTFQERHPDWIYARYEDLAAEPLPGFEALYDQLGLELNARARGTIEEHCYARTPLTDQGEVHRLVRNSSDDAWSWRGRMSAEEVERVRALVEPISGLFYTDETWNLTAAVAS